MPAPDIRRELAAVIESFGANPLRFFWILHDSENPNLDFRSRNAAWADLKDETWHSLHLRDYQLWAISDNGDLLWWNGEQTVVMRPRDSEFISMAISPVQFMRLLVSGKLRGYFPEGLLASSPKNEA
jgi:hypothetical protein